LGLRKEYDPERLERYWQQLWENRGVFRASLDRSRPKYYVLIEFPYPSGEGLHVGHPRSYTALDMVARKRRMEGYNVLYPIGWDAFGLPTENYAIKHKVHPRDATEKNIIRFREQLQRLGFSFDWSREVNTTDPAYYRWTQWIFLKFFEQGLAYKAEIPINWCTECKVGLANEEVVAGTCERCGGAVVPKVKSQWLLRITAYAQRLLDDLETVDYLEKIKAQQKNWIGRSEGVEIDFAVAGTAKSLRVFTTRPDTLFGATYMVLSPEHPLLDQLIDLAANRAAVEAYRIQAAGRPEFERTELPGKKSGVPLQGVRAINPASGKAIPVWVADYVLMSYGTGAIMAVPGHDLRDWEFARKYNLPVVEVIKGGDVNEEAYTNVAEGILTNSGFLDGLPVAEAIAQISDWLEAKGLGQRKIHYKLRDWVFSRQRYWGEPIPLIYCAGCGWVAVPDNELPVTLPQVRHYETTRTGESPLAAIKEWVETTCPRCGGPGRRETDTMPQWAGSSWYFLRYADPRNQRAPAGPAEIAYWLPVDWYNGGMEHTTLHLLYSRFWHKFLYDIGVVATPEPYCKRTSHGMVLGENNEKMSKSRGNVVNPDSVVKKFGGDTFRLYEVFMGAFEQAIPWSQQGVKGCRRFLERVWRLPELLAGGDEYSAGLAIKMHRTVKKVTEDIEKMKFNTAVAALMELLNDFYAQKKITRRELAVFLILLNPAAPHITEELWRQAGFPGYLHQQRWPSWDEAKTVEDCVEIAVQVDGRLRGTLRIRRGEPAEAVKREALQIENVAKHLAGKEIRQEIYVPDRIYNIVTG
jgi:leucyl-tRNA synthetase